MHTNWMTSCFLLAMLIIPLASLSSATCPLFIGNELYSAECGVIKEVPATSGILANDPGAMDVLKPEGISIDPKYGTIKVQANGSFVYNPSPSIQSGTYVTFQYGATNGACDAKNLGSAKIQVSCKCRPNAMNITVCMPTDFDEVKAKLIAAGAGCWGCGDNTPVFDLSLVKLQPGIYPYLLKCQNCTAVTGIVTITAMYQAYAPDITFCESEVALAELLEMIDENAACIGQDCNQSPAINVDNVAVENGFVAGGSYTVTCGEGTACKSSGTGNITVTRECKVEAISLTVTCTTLVELMKLLEDTQPCGDCRDATLLIDDTNVTVGDDGFVSGGNYTATCIAGSDCESSATGEIISTGGCKFCSCVAVAAPIEVCLGSVSRAALKAMIWDGNATCEDFPGLPCDSALKVNLSNVDVNYNGYVTGGSYMVTCGADHSCPPAWSTVTAIDCPDRS